MATANVFESILALDVREEADCLRIRPCAQILARTASWDDLPWIVARRDVPIRIDLTSLEPMPSSALVRWLLRVAGDLKDRDYEILSDARISATLRLLAVDRLLGRKRPA